MEYLDAFFKTLGKEWRGSLVRVRDAERVDANAKKFLSLLAGQGRVERVAWGWYWVPDTYKDFFDFMVRDKNAKVLHKQSAASFWNGDFIHRDYYTVAVRDESYGRALEQFAGARGWRVQAEARDLDEISYEKVDGICVESLEDAIIDCLKEWAFADAFAALQENRDRVDMDELSRRYWERIPGTSVRVGQVLKYAANIMNRETGRELYASTRVRISDDFVKRQVEDAAGKVLQFRIADTAGGAGP